MVSHQGAAVRARHSLGRFFVDGHVLTSVAQDLGHPDQLADEPVRTSHEGFIEQPAVVREYFSHLADVDVPEERDESQFAHDGQEALHDADSGERPRGHADKPYGLVDVLAETAVERVLQQPGKTVVVLGCNDDKTISGADGRRERRVLDRFAGIVDRERHRRDVDDLASDPGPAIEQIGEEARGVDARAAFAARAEDHRDIEAAELIHRPVLVWLSLYVEPGWCV